MFAVFRIELLRETFNFRRNYIDCIRYEMSIEKADDLFVLEISKVPLYISALV